MPSSSVDLADAERRRDLLDETAECSGRQRPDLDLEALPFEAGLADEAGFRRHGVRQDEEPVVAGRAAGLQTRRRPVRSVRD